MYCAIGDLKQAAEEIRGFPAKISDARELVLGTFDRNYTGGGIALKFYCVGGAGHSFVEARIESGYERAGTYERVLLSLPVEAAAVDIFVDGLVRLETARVGKAYLTGVRKAIE